MGEDDPKCSEPKPVSFTAKIKDIVNEIAHKSLKHNKICHFFSRKLVMKNQFSRPKGLENVSNMSQSVWNIIVDDRNHVLDLKKSHKGCLEKAPHRP